MNATQRTGLMQYWRVVQEELMPGLRDEIGDMTPKLEKLIHTLEWVRIDEFVRTTWIGWGRPTHDRISLASAFVAKAVLGLDTTVALIERLTMDRALRRICGFSMWRKLPSEATFSRAFEGFAEERPPKMTTIQRQKRQALEKIRAELPRECDRGTMNKPNLLPKNEYYELGGLYKQQQIAFRGLIQVFAAAVALVSLAALFVRALQDRAIGHDNPADVDFRDIQRALGERRGTQIYPR